MNLFFDGRVLKHKSFSGVENYASFILNALVKEASLKCLKPKSSNKYIQHLWEHFKLPFLVRSQSVLFCPANIAPFFLSKNKKLVLTLHDVAFKTFPKSVSRFFYWYYTFIIPFNIKRANKIITISETSKEEILNVYPEAKGKITVITLGIDEKYKVLSDIQKKKQILYVGSINERKNLIGAIKAFERLPQYLEFTLVIVGNVFGNFTVSKELNVVLNRARNNKSIYFKQGLDDEALVNEYNISTCLLFPSFYEGFGLPPLEAMACGTPVITSNLSSMLEICGNIPMYIDPTNIDDISTKLEILLVDKNKQIEMSRKGLEWVKQFTWDKSAKEHLNIFKEVVSQ